MRENILETQVPIDSKLMAAELITDYFYDCLHMGLKRVSMYDILIYLGVDKQSVKEYCAIEGNDKWFELTDLPARSDYDRILIDYGAETEAVHLTALNATPKTPKPPLEDA